MIGLGEILVILTIGLVGGILIVIPAILICRRIGVHPLIGLLAAVPITNILLLWYIAFAPWPALREGAAAE